MAKPNPRWVLLYSATGPFNDVCIIDLVRHTNSHGIHWNQGDRYSPGPHSRIKSLWLDKQKDKVFQYNIIPKHKWESLYGRIDYP